MENIRKNLELIEVVYNDTKKKAVLTFLDVENGEVLEVNFNKQAYDNGQFIDSDEKAAKVDEWCKEYFNCTFDKLSDQVGVRKDVYRYDGFNSLWESVVTRKFDKSDEGKIIQTEIARIEDDGKGVRIYFEHEGDEYESKMMYSDYIEHLAQWFVNPQKRRKQYGKFKEKFGYSIEEKDKIVGCPIMVEVKVAFKKHAYADIKKPSWNKE